MQQEKKPLDRAGQSVAWFMLRTLPKEAWVSFDASSIDDVDTNKYPTLLHWLIANITSPDFCIPALQYAMLQCPPGSEVYGTLDSSGYTPFHVACRYVTDMKIIVELLHRTPETLWKIPYGEQHQRTPLSLVTRRATDFSSRDFEQFLDLMPDSAFTDGGPTNATPLLELSLLCTRHMDTYPIPSPFCEYLKALSARTPIECWKRKGSTRFVKCNSPEDWFAHCAKPVHYSGTWQAAPPLHHHDSKYLEMMQLSQSA